MERRLPACRRGGCQPAFLRGRLPSGLQAGCLRSSVRKNQHARAYVIACMNRLTRTLIATALTFSFAPLTFAAKTPDLAVIRAALHSYVKGDGSAKSTKQPLILRDTTVRGTPSTLLTSRHADEPTLGTTLQSNNDVPLDVTGIANAELITVVTPDYTSGGKADWKKIEKMFPGKAPLLAVSKPAYLANGTAVVQLTEIGHDRDVTYVYELAKDQNERWTVRWSGTK